MIMVSGFLEVKMQTNMNRKYLEFPEMVKNNFRFLERERGFTVIEESETFVQYRSQSLFINIYHGRRSYEVGFEVGRLDEVSPVNVYRLTIILSALAPGYKGQTFFQATNKEALRNCVSQISLLVKMYCQDLLINNKSAWNNLEQSAELLEEEIRQKYAVSPVKNQALEAWQRRDFKEVVRIYESVMTELEDVELKRLAYARKKIKGIKE